MDLFWFNLSREIEDVVLQFYGLFTVIICYNQQAWIYGYF